MKKVEIPLPELGLIAATRSMLGAGIGLLLAGQMSGQRRTLVGRILLAVGALSTVPLVVDVLHRRKTRGPSRR